MPKQKTHKGAKKRIEITGSGKLRRRVPGGGHLLEKKRASTKRRYSRKVGFKSSKQVKIFKRMLA